MSPAVNSRFGSQVGTYNAEIINIYNSDIGDRVKIGSFTEIGGAIIGADTTISAFVFICPGVIIGERCFIGPRVTFTNHKYPKIDPDFIPEKTIVEDDVVIGAGVLVLPGITIGKGAKIGAGAVLTGDVASGTTVMGFPARERNDIWVEGTPPVAHTHTHNDVYGPGSYTDSYKKIFQGQKDAIMDEEIKKFQEDIGVSSKDEDNFDVKTVMDILRKQGYKTDGNNYKVVEDFSSEAFAKGYGSAQTNVNEHEFKTEFVGQAHEPQFYGEMSDTSSKDVPEIDYEKFKKFMTEDEDIFISRTKKCKGKCMEETKAEEGDFVGLNMGFRKE
jgi:acetyltransferase-like isoleucine patch superfamily enzyme